MTAKHTAGMTLIELMIVVAIAAILAAIAVPSYSAYVRRAQRSDATVTLLRLAAAQEKYYIQNNTYANTAQITALGLNATEHGWYSIAITTPSTLTREFTATATPVSGSPQAADEDCVSLAVTQSGERRAKDSGGADNIDKCWR